MARGQKEEYTYKKVKRGKYDYWSVTVTTGYCPITGKQQRKAIYGKTKTEVKEKLREYEEKQLYIGKVDNSKLGDFFYYWLFEVRKNNLKPSSFDRYEGIYRNYIKSNEKLSNTKVTELKKEQLQRYYNALLTSGKTVSQVKNINRYLGACLNYAESEEIIKRNPCKGIQFPNDYSVNNKDEEENYINEEKQKVLINALKGNDLELLILLGLLCGMRLGEILALTPSDIDFNNKTINIYKSMKRVPKIESDGTKTYIRDVTLPKTKNSIRVIPLPYILIDKFKSTINKNKENKLKFGELYYNGNLIFCKPNGEPIDDKLPNRRLKSICKKAGIEENLHFHSLRHIFISNCVNNGIPPQVVMKLAGHSSIEITINIYSKISNKNIKDNFEVLNKLYEEMN